MQVSIDDLDGIKLITPTVFRDERGFFFESYNQSVVKKKGIESSFVQDNISFSKKGTIRALHYQSGLGQAKLITCLKGSIWDVVVDIRPDSKTFKNWAAVELDDQLFSQLFIPEGFAHGYCVLSFDSLVQYKVSTPYNKENEMSIRWNDPTIGVRWPIRDPILSERDRKSPFFNEIFE